VVIEDAGIARLLSTGYGRAKVNQIQNKKNIMIQRSNFGRRIQITGNSEAKRRARTQIEKLIEDLQKTTHLEIDLRHSDRPVGAIREILKHFGKDLNKLVEGEDCQASMEIRRRKVVLRGAKEAVSQVQNKIEEFLKTLPNSQRETNVDNECPVCLADVEDPYVLTLCGHAYCSACITQYLSNVFDSVKSADMFPQKCMCEECESPSIKEDYVALLKTEQIQKLYQVSLECFLIGNTSYKPCPTPDCSWVYEVTPVPGVFACPECDIRFCKKCGDSAHDKFDTCEAYKASKEGLSKSEQQLKEWAKGADTRECPKCSVMIEKNKGCSHVNCRQCNAHICWKCGEFFKTDTACYSHIAICEKK
jgi:ATP-dependent RNA helicase DHX8/PRP22